MVAIGHHHTAQHVAVPGQIFGQAVDGEVRTELERADDQRGGERVVHHQGGARFPRDGGDGIDLPHAQQGIGNGLDQDASGAGFGDRLAQLVEIPDIGEPHTDARRLHDVQQQSNSGSIGGFRGHHRFPAIHQRGCHGHLHRRHARRARQGPVPALERRQQLFQGGVGGVVVAGVAIAVLFAREDPVELLHRIVEVARRRMNGSGHRRMRSRLFLAVAGMHRLGMNLQLCFLFQRTPLRVSSSTIPRWCNSSRIWSARAKSLAFLAAMRPATSDSTSASEIRPA